MLNQLFLPFEVKRILNIRLSPNEPKDSWYWCLDKEGEYSVKTAYASIVGDLYELGGPSNWEKERWLWNRLWKVRVWPRIKLFFWQLCSGALATLENITTRVRGESLTPCYFCSSNPESCLHLFRDCSVAKWVWDALGVDWNDGGDGVECAGGVREWVECLWRGLEVGEYWKCMVGCWAIWEHRNKMIFDKEVLKPARIVQRTRDILAEIDSGGIEGQCRVGRNGVDRREQENEGWRPAMGGYVKINVDAGVKEG
ncbi:uncharacterized protein LOC141613414 [Silene latifolia]|uniref:uncharacterized protein LOC141613414 n=1 Tax=Silene latifolia TaxID=37657 RepID=UPI003D77180D